jgi:hypothetical protein
LTMASRCSPCCLSFSSNCFRFVMSCNMKEHLSSLTRAKEPTRNTVLFTKLQGSSQSSGFSEVRDSLKYFIHNCRTSSGIPSALEIVMKPERLYAT